MSACFIPTAQINSSRRPGAGGEIYLCLSIAEDMYMRRLMVVRENHDPETR
jgi:hypothetical protein